MSVIKSFYVICQLDRGLANGDSGFVKPLFYDDYTPVTELETEFPGNGRIWVSKGYKTLAQTFTTTDFLRVRVDFETDRFDPSESHRNSKYACHSNAVEKLPALTICPIAQADLPDPSITEFPVASMIGAPPSQGFFLKTTGPRGTQVLVGPLDPIERSISEYDEGTRFSYSTVSRPMKGAWARLMEAPQTAFMIETDVLAREFVQKVGDTEYLVDANKLQLDLVADLIDLQNDNELRNWVRRLLKRQLGVSLKKIAELQARVADLRIPAGFPDRIWEERIQRLLELSDGTAIQGNIEPLDEQVRRYVEQNRADLISAYLSDDLKGERQRRLSTLNIEVELERDVLTGDHRRLRKQIEEAQEELSSLTQGVEKERAARAELQTLMGQIEDLKTQYKQWQKVISLDTEVTALERQRSKLEANTSDLKDLIDDQRDSLTKINKDGVKSLLKLKQELDVLSGGEQVEFSANLFTAPRTFLQVDVSQEFWGETLFRESRKTLNSVGYELDDQTLLSVLVAMSQNLITTLVGPPGSGKSFLAASLSKAFGLCHEENSLHVQVQRGWTSDRQLLGFYNSLTQNFEPDSYGVVRLIKALSEYKADVSQGFELNTPLGLIVLDEANLSPIEHYWSSFMGASDAPERFSCAPNISGLPKSIRFLATVNSDATTEPLSDRFVNRSAVIRLSQGALDDLDLGVIANAGDVLPGEREISHEILRQAFAPSSEELLPDERRIFDQLMTYRETGVIKLSARNLSSAYNFVLGSRNTFTNLGLRGADAVDRAIAMFILPSISGQSSRFRRCLEELQSALDDSGMEYSAQLVSEILRNSEFDTFTFFHP